MKTIQEHEGTLCGVPGRFSTAHVWPDHPHLWSTQQWHSEWRHVPNEGGYMRVEARFDDNCKNGHNTFSITAEIYKRKGSERDSDFIAGGCLHDEIEKYFPELTTLIKWHLCSTDGPMHYLANTLWHASDKDHNGLRKGERRQLRNGRTKLLVWNAVVRNAEGEDVGYTFNRLVDAEECPQNDLTISYEPVWIEGEGKARDLNYARSCAVWPEATDAELMAEPQVLSAVLQARLPRLLEDFQRDIEAAGFVWQPQPKGAAAK